MSADELKQKSCPFQMKKKFCLLSLLGGSPFKVSSTIMGENQSKQWMFSAGLDLAMLMEAVFARMAHSFDEVVNRQ